jgi:hypothetical protein
LLIPLWEWMVTAGLDLTGATAPLAEARICQAAGPAGCRAEAWVGEERIFPRDAGELAACFAAHAGSLFGYACVLTRRDRLPRIEARYRTARKAKSCSSRIGT